MDTLKSVNIWICAHLFLATGNKNPSGFDVSIPVAFIHHKGSWEPMDELIGESRLDVKCLPEHTQQTIWQTPKA